MQLADLLAGPPPKDVLGRMLYYLAQVRGRSRRRLPGTLRSHGRLTDAVCLPANQESVGEGGVYFVCSIPVTLPHSALHPTYCRCPLPRTS